MDKETLDYLRREYGKLDSIDPDGAIYKRLCRILDSASDKALIEAKNANIKFVSSLALNRCISRGLLKNGV